MSHKFSIKNIQKLDNPERRKMLPPKEILLQLNLKENDVFADIGCGVGYFTYPASEIVGNGGKVYAIDSSKEMLEELIRRSDYQENISVINSSDTKILVEDESVNLAFMCTVLHEIENKDIFSKEVNRILKTDGRIVIIEWEKKESKIGPKYDHRIDKSLVKELLKNNNFNNFDEINLDENFYCIIGYR